MHRSIVASEPSLRGWHSRRIRVESSAVMSGTDSNECRDLVMALLVSLVLGTVGSLTMKMMVEVI